MRTITVALAFAALTVLGGTAVHAQAMTCELAAKAVWLPVTAQKYGGDEKDIAKRVVAAKVFRDKLSAPGAEEIGCDYRISYNDGSVASGIAFFRRIPTGGWELDDWRSNDDLSRAYTPDDVPSAPDNGAPCQAQLTALNEWARTADALASQAAGPQLPDFAAWNASRAVGANERYLEARMNLVACAEANGLTVEWDR